MQYTMSWGSVPGWDGLVTCTVGITLSPLSHATQATQVGVNAHTPHAPSIQPTNQPSILPTFHPSILPNPPTIHCQQSCAMSRRNQRCLPWPHCVYSSLPMQREERAWQGREREGDIDTGGRLMSMGHVRAHWTWSGNGGMMHWALVLPGCCHCPSITHHV
jgi:hypothetical protein